MRRSLIFIAPFIVVLMLIACRRSNPEATALLARADSLLNPAPSTAASQTPPAGGPQGALHLLDGSFLTTTTAYNFTDKPLTVQTTLHTANRSFPIVETFTYDEAHLGQPKYHDLTYADSTVRVCSYSYDDLARLALERKHDQHVSTGYSYNLHGWPTSVNTTKTYGNYSTLFNQDLYYETGQGTPCYNGNISSMRWRWNNSNSGHGFTFAYDSRDRLTSANHTLYNMNAYPILYSEQMTYNRNSAITSLTRTGNGSSNYGNMDVLVYSYAGNKLQYIYDYGVSNIFDGIFEFVTNTIPTSGTRYTYNSAGDLTQDANKGLSLIEYDLLGHPRRIQHHNGNVTEYVYAATGEKLRVKHTTAVGGLSVPLGQTLELTDAQTMDVDSVDYWGKWQLTKEDIVNHHGVVGLTYQFGGGYFAVMPKRYRPPHSVAVGIQHIPSFFYYVTDYQGNVRLVVDGNGAMAQRNDYYAYGGPWGDNASTQGFQPFKYNGKELDRVHGLDWYDYEARMYDPAMGLFTQIDPQCEQYPHVNPYQYCAGNPVKCVDPDGRDWITAIYGKDVFYFFDDRVKSQRDISELYYNGEKSDNRIKYYGNKGNIYDKKGTVMFMLNEDGTFSNAQQNIIGHEIDESGYHIGNSSMLSEMAAPSNWYGFYLGPNNPTKRSKGYSYALPPINDLDYAAFLHDRGYDLHHAVGVEGALFNPDVASEDMKLALRSYFSSKGSVPFTKKHLFSIATSYAFGPIALFKYYMNIFKK